MSGGRNRVKGQNLDKKSKFQVLEALTPEQVVEVGGGGVVENQRNIVKWPVKTTNA